MIEEGLYAFLAAQLPAIGGRVYPDKLPQEPVLPAVTYRKVSGPRVHSHDGPSSLAHPRFQVSCWAATYAEAKDLSEDVRQALDGYTGAMDGEQVQAVLLSNEIDFHHGEVMYYQVALDFVIWHREI